MQKSILQIPLDKNLRDVAEKVASKQGFSSLQEVVRVFLTQLASDKIEINIEKSVKLSSKNEKKYSKMTRDFESGRNIFSAENPEDLVSKLNEDQVP